MRVFRQNKNVLVISLLMILGLAMSAVAQSEKTTSVPSPETFKPTLKLKNFGQINTNYFRGARPADQDYKTLAAMGIKTIVNLERDGDSTAQQKAEAAGLKFYLIRMSDSETPSDSDVQKFLEIANDPANQPIYVHCKGGRHRTGMVTAVYRMVHDGWTSDQAYAEMKKFDFSYGFGHGNLKDYVFAYHTKGEPNSTVGTSVASEPKK
jgi:protein tyrosine/serine phosphatase